jgi:hypothetical protein
MLGGSCYALKRKTVAVLYQYGQHQRILKIILNQLNAVLIIALMDKETLASGNKARLPDGHGRSTPSAPHTGKVELWLWRGKVLSFRRLFILTRSLHPLSFFWLLFLQSSYTYHALSILLTKLK